MENTITISFENVFSESFHTYKAFSGLKVEEVGIRLERSPKTIWQILNHLILWQNHQLEIISECITQKQFWEIDSWIEDKKPSDQAELDKAIQTFDEQISQFDREIKSIRVADLKLEQKIKAIHEAATHLSFHLGEVIHIRRILGEYPMPEQMKEFLAN
jgi:hypothetical protein